MASLFTCDVKLFKLFDLNYYFVCNTLASVARCRQYSVVFGVLASTRDRFGLSLDHLKITGQQRGGLSSACI